MGASHKLEDLAEEDRQYLGDAYKKQVRAHPGGEGGVGGRTGAPTRVRGVQAWGQGRRAAQPSSWGDAEAPGDCTQGMHRCTTTPQTLPPVTLPPTHTHTTPARAVLCPAR